MAEFEIHITDFKVSADKKGWVSFWCKNNSSATVPRDVGSYHILIRDVVGHNLAENETGQPGDFKPGDVVRIDNMYVGDWRYPIASGIFVVSVLWRWVEEGKIIALVYDTKRYTIELEGEAVITKLEVPDSFVPGTDVQFMALVKNTGGDDDFFFRIVNRDTGGVICSTSFHLRSGRTWEIPKLSGVITQTTDFHGRAEAGHET